MEKKIRVVVVDDHQLMRQGLVAMLLPLQNICVCGEASNGKDLLERIEFDRPDVVILDLQMPVMDGYAVLPVLKRDYPTVKIIVLTGFEGEALTRHLFSNGAHAHLLKSCEQDDLIACIEKVQAGVYGIAESLIANSKVSIFSNYLLKVRFPELSNREVEILQEFCSGKTYRQISESLAITIQTVKFHFQNIHVKIGVKSPAELVKFALLHGITHLDKR